MQKGIPALCPRPGPSRRFDGVAGPSKDARRSPHTPQLKGNLDDILPDPAGHKDDQDTKGTVVAPLLLATPSPPKGLGVWCCQMGGLVNLINGAFETKETVEARVADVDSTPPGSAELGSNSSAEMASDFTSGEQAAEVALASASGQSSPTKPASQGSDSSPRSGSESSPEQASVSETAALPAEAQGAMVKSPSGTSSSTTGKSPVRQRILMLGSTQVGKTSIVARFLGKDFPKSHAPTVEDYHRKLYRVSASLYEMELYDLAGFNCFQSHRRMTYINADMFIVVFDMSNHDSFEEAQRLREAVLVARRRAAENMNPRRSPRVIPPPMVFAGNKSDIIPKKVTLSEIKKYVNKLECCAFVEVSALQNLNVEELFATLLQLAKLPTAMAPNRHLAFTTEDGTMPDEFSRKKGPPLMRRYSFDACGVVTLNSAPQGLSFELDIMQSRMKRPLPRSNFEPRNMCSTQ